MLSECSDFRLGQKESSRNTILRAKVITFKLENSFQKSNQEYHFMGSWFSFPFSVQSENNEKNFISSQIFLGSYALPTDR